MKKHLIMIINYFIVSSLLSPVWAFGRGQYEITITNLTRGQIFSPALVALHKGDVKLFELGAPASAELAALAQDGETSGLADSLLAMPTVGNVMIAPDALLPGATTLLEIEAARGFNYLSLAAMMVTTNDGFIALNGVMVPKLKRMETYMSPGYDAGSEDNDEMCDYIPGPPCGHPHQASAMAGEGYIHIHAGIQGVGDLSSAEFDWRNPVAKITIRRVYNW